MRGTTYRSETTRFSTTIIELGIKLKSPYIDYERLRFSMSLSKSKSNSWFLFGSFSNQYSSLL
jgi:hypothetical protein